jgi:energy-coupling factor transporter ATP-binding protein EcfA2
MTTRQPPQPEPPFGPMFEKLFDPKVPIASRQALFAELRQNQPQWQPRIDQAVLQRDLMHAEAVRKLGALIDELRAETARLTAPPVSEGVFVAPCVASGAQRLARVVLHGTREALLVPKDDALLDTLRAGDVVLVAGAGNVVLGKADCAAPGAGDCAIVERWLGADRLVLRHRDQVLVARAAASLAPAEVEAGDCVRVDRTSGFAMERVPAPDRHPQAPDDEATSLPEDALAGYDDLRDGKLRQIGYAVAHPQAAAAYGLHRQRPWILLGGPPGVGKTTLARVIAGVLHRQTGRRCRIRKLNGAELLSPYVGETEQRIRTFVRELRAAGDEWSIVFIDEVDAIARARGGAGNVHSDRFLGTWLAELEGFEGRAPCILIAATNRLDMVDPAFRSRCSEEIEMPRPRMDAARAIFAHHLPEGLPYAAPGGANAAETRTRMIDAAVARLYLPNAPGALLATLRLRDGKTRAVHARDLMSGRLVEQICVDARRRAFQRHVEGDDAGLGLPDIDAAVDAARDRLRATLTPFNAHAHLGDLPADLAVVAVDPAPRARGSVTFVHEAAR